MAGYDRIVARSFGGPEVLVLEHTATVPEPGKGEVRVRVEAAGVGYTDTILRRGRYIAYSKGLPLIPGYDVAGVVDGIGADVMALEVGDRVADMTVHGGYSQFIVRPATSLIPVPPGIDAAIAVEIPLMWVTAWQMLTRIVSLPRGATVLVVGASGAVGRALVRLGRHLGLQIIGTCSATNLELVEALGATGLDYHRADLQQAILLASGGKGVAASFDAIGGYSWETSWRTLAQGGVLVGYGFQDFLESNAPSAEAGRAIHRFNEVLNGEGTSDGTERRTIFYDIHARRVSHPDEYRSDAEHLLGLIADGSVAPPDPEVLPLGQAAEAHRRIAQRGVKRRIVLRP